MDKIYFYTHAQHTFRNGTDPTLRPAVIWVPGVQGQRAGTTAEHVTHSTLPGVGGGRGGRRRRAPARAGP